MGTKRNPADRRVLHDWWPTLGSIALPPPAPGRQGMEQASAEAQGPSFVCWLAPDTAVFNRAGALTGPLPLHWSGDHAVVRAALGAGPAGYAITDGGPGAPFLFDRDTACDADGLPFPDDPAGVRRFLAGLGSTLTETEAAWLHERLNDFDAATPYIGVLDDRGELTRDELDHLLTAWRDSGRTIYWRGWRHLTRALLRAEHPEAWDVVDELLAHASDVLAEVPTKRGLEKVRSMALRGSVGAVAAWLRIRRALHEPDTVDAAAAIAVELPENAMLPLVKAVRRELAGKDVAAGRAVVLRLALDERLPREARVHAARLTHEWTSRSGDPDGFDAADLLSGTGLDVTLSDSDLGKIWHRHRVLSADDVGWLKARIADPATGLKGIAICLELLYAHGEATAAEVDALAPRWKTVLAKTYKTTYAEWRHPLVTLTCLARDLGHPLAVHLEKWWARPAPKWKDPLRPLTWLGAPDEDAAARLWDHATSGTHDTGHMLTWVLMRARLDGVPPRRVAAGLVGQPGMREYVMKRVLVGTADPAQPLWHYDVDVRSWGWWDRAVDIAEDASLPEPARALARKVAADHYLLHHPDQVKPPPTPAEIVAAAKWVAG